MDTYSHRDMTVAGVVGMLVGAALSATVFVASPPEPDPVTADHPPIGCFEDEFGFVGTDGEQWCVPIDDVVPPGPYADEFGQTARKADL